MEQGVRLRANPRSKFYKGALVAININTMEAERAKDKAGLEVVGVCMSGITKDGDGKRYCEIAFGVYRLKNSIRNPVLNSKHLGKMCYVENGNTVSSCKGKFGVEAGKVIGVDSNGVWVDITYIDDLAIGMWWKESIMRLSNNIKYLTKRLR